MGKKILLITLGFSLVIGGFWAGQAQDPPTPKPGTVKTEAPATAAQSMQTDLSGTYAGTFNCEAIGLTGDTTLTINGNEFTTADGRTGRIVASTTRGYTAVALQMIAPGTATTTTTPAPVVSLRAKKSGNRLTLMSVGGAAQKCSFTPSRNVARSKRNQKVPAATGTEVSNPVAQPTPAAQPTAVPAESPMPSQPPAPSPTPSPNPEPVPSATPNPSPEPVPSPTPNPSPEPVPSPTPGGSPAPSPSPTPTPSPSPTPRG